MTTDETDVLGQQNAPDDFVVASQQVYGLEAKWIGDV
jgi:hypothetical protein